MQVKCFAEIINIGYAVYKIHGLPWFRSLSWYFLITSNYFFYGESLVDYFGVVDNRTVKYYLQYDSKTVDVIVHIFIRNFYVRWSSTIDSSRFLCILEVSCGSSCH